MALVRLHFLAAAVNLQPNEFDFDTRVFFSLDSMVGYDYDTPGGVLKHILSYCEYITFDQVTFFRVERSRGIPG